jgi:TonB family protein
VPVSVTPRGAGPEIITRHKFQPRPARPAPARKPGAAATLTSEEDEEDALLDAELAAATEAEEGELNEDGEPIRQPRVEPLPPAAASTTAAPPPAQVAPPAPAAPPVVASPAPAPAPEISDVVPFGEGMTRPVQISGDAPVYSREAIASGAQGTMIIRCVITHEGKVERCRVLKTVAILEDAVVKALLSRRYEPARYQGKAVSVEYVFTLQLVPPRR